MSDQHLFIASLVQVECVWPLRQVMSCLKLLRFVEFLVAVSSEHILGRFAQMSWLRCFHHCVLKSLKCLNLLFLCILEFYKQGSLHPLKFQRFLFNLRNFILYSVQLFRFLRADPINFVFKIRILHHDSLSLLLTHCIFASLIFQFILHSPIVDHLTINSFLNFETASFPHFLLLNGLNLALELGVCTVFLFLDTSTEALLFSMFNLWPCHCKSQVLLILCHNLSDSLCFRPSFMNLSQSSLFFLAKHAHTVFKLLDIILYINPDGVSLRKSQIICL